MSDFPISAKIKNYKCYGEPAQGFEVIKPINVIVGRNNSGKSALIDVIQQTCRPTPQFPATDSPAGTTASIVYSAKVTEDVARMVFRQDTSGGDIRGGSHWAAGQQYVGKEISWEQLSNADINGRRLAGISENLSGLYTNQGASQTYETNLAKAMVNPLEGLNFRRLTAERDVRPETENDQLDPLPTGQNVTNLIQTFANVARFDRRVIDVVLLRALNSITQPDYSFSAITPRRQADGKWEIFLSETEKGLIALSASGSGLKTILCVLAHMAIWPIHAGKQLSACVFGFEELENSLHPALLRRLLQYVGRRIREEDGHIFLTTHSPIAIDMFASAVDAQIVHTAHRSGESATVTTTSEYLHRRNVLDDLDVRASDLLQANGIVWVEGPSDRTIVNRWITLGSNGLLKEGAHYQCVFYGGKLLAHLSAQDPEEVEEFLSILKVNRNAAILIDSDQRQVGDQLNRTKQRILAEVAAVNGFAWVTAGREIENYLPVQAIAAVEDLQNPADLGQFQDIADYLEEQIEGAGRRFEKSKAEFAARAIGAITTEQQSQRLDWRDKIDGLCAAIRSWNRIT